MLFPLFNIFQSKASGFQEKQGPRHSTTGHHWPSQSFRTQHPKNPVPPVMKIRWPPHFFPQVVGVRQDMIEVVGKGV